ncbi:MAG: hypothetical protein HQ591_08695 [candidate division Zixibacteria bacterium]|nr:hypothetical protein [Candidatus Tariuqbacter arcticus]
MDRFFKNILLLIFVVVLITGVFFGTRGCGLVKTSNSPFSSLSNQRALMGPVLALKNRQLILNPGSGMWKRIDASNDDWETEAIYLLERRLSEVLDTILFLDGIPKSDITDFILQSVTLKLSSLDLEKLCIGETSLSLNITDFILSHRNLMKPGVSSMIDSLLFGKRTGISLQTGNF